LSTDQVIGWLIFGACVGIAIGYLTLLIAPQWVADFVGAGAETIRF